MSGTDIACYAMSGTDIACYAMSGTDIACYAMSGTDLAYAATTRLQTLVNFCEQAASPSLCCYARATRCPVKPASCLRESYAMSGTDLAYGLSVYAMSGTEIACSATGLQVRYAMPGTDLAYEAVCAWY
eukprot:2038507-Rhodomonas_salina.1